VFAGKWSRSKCPIGIDVGTHSVKLMQLEKHGDRCRVTAMASQALPADLSTYGPEYHHAVGQAIAQLCTAGQFTGCKVVSSLPAAALTYKSVRLPIMPADELTAAVQWEAADRLQAAGEPARVQYFKAGEITQGEEIRQEIIVMSAAESLVDAHTQMLLRCGLHPVAIETVPSALARCLALGAESPTQVRVAIDIGYASTKVIILRGCDVLFFKLIDTGGRIFDHSVAEHLGMAVAEASQLRRRLCDPIGCEDNPQQAPADQARRENAERAVYEAIRPKVTELAREIGLCLRYYSVTFRGRRPERAMLLGGEAHQRQLPELLASEAGIAIEIGEPLLSMDVAPVQSALVREGGAAWAVAAGLSLRQQSRVVKRGAA
jgi:type IV pilus assembly protein PilM